MQIHKVMVVPQYRQKASYKCQNVFDLLRDSVKWKSGKTTDKEHIKICLHDYL